MAAKTRKDKQIPGEFLPERAMQTRKGRLKNGRNQLHEQVCRNRRISPIEQYKFPSGTARCYAYEVEIFLYENT